MAESSQRSQDGVLRVGKRNNGKDGMLGTLTTHLYPCYAPQVLQGSVRPQTEDDDVKTAAPRGRWAENPSLVMKSVLDENSPMKLPLSDTFSELRHVVLPPLALGVLTGQSDGVLSLYHPSI